MNVLKSYAHQVASYHPETVRDDLYAEIYDELCEEFEDWKLQNPDKSESDFLDDHKEHPARYAARLVSDGSAYLVGPRYYFSFLSALKTGAVITGGFYLFLAVISALATGEYWSSFWRMLYSIPVSLLWVSAVILGIFVAVEKSGERASWLDKWTASDLKPIESHQQISRAETFFDLGLSTFGLLWLADVIPLPLVIRQDGNWVTEWVVNLPDWFWGVLAVLLAFDIGFCVLRLVREFWSRGLRVTTVVTNLLWIAMLVYVLSSPSLLSVQGQMATDAPQLLVLVNKVLNGIMIGIISILAWDTVKHIRRLAG